MEINIFSSYNDLGFHVSKREQLNYCRFEALLRIAVWGLFIFRGGAFFFQEYSNREPRKSLQRIKIQPPRLF